MQSNKYEVAIAGAGPSGALAAILLARVGFSVLLLDKAVFPRHKVCGCCLSRQTMAILDEVGLGGITDNLRAKRLDQLIIYSGRSRRQIKLPLIGSYSLSRQVFDQFLVNEAIACGATFMPATTAKVTAIASESVAINLSSAEGEATVDASIFLAADGVGGTALQSLPDFTQTVARHSLMGLGAISMAASPLCPASIHMIYAPCGYLGLVQLEDNRTDMAAAFHPSYLRKCGTASSAIRQLLKNSALPPPGDLDQLFWRGTVSLTRRRKLAGHRIFVIGDAASYVEPFTGEGIGWALSSACGVVPFVKQAHKKWEPDLVTKWSYQYQKVIGKRQLKTRLIAALLKHPAAAESLAELLNAVPALADRLVHFVTAPQLQEELQWLQ